MGHPGDRLLPKTPQAELAVYQSWGQHINPKRMSDRHRGNSTIRRLDLDLTPKLLG
ncbi:hypothetical protein [Oscillatoria acuminata]|uniref:hypothetical protein n=1 Tax=Oscillatoria acuminata TaxID=118323 RepID=UPI0002EA049E|nr:hypothetical protein [Oscillatoria acuminata]